MSVDYRTGQNLFPFAVKPNFTLAEIEERLRKSKVLGNDGLSRRTLIHLCESGTLKSSLTNKGWIVDQESFHEWLAEQLKGFAAFEKVA
jgi:hypothetical protein